MTKLKKVERESLSEQVYRRLRGALIDGDYEPGDRLRIAALAESLGVSGTPVREAIFRLVSEGAVEMSVGAAIRVPLIAPEQLREILFIRRMLEGAAAEQAAQVATAKEIAELRRIHEAFMEIAQTDARRASARNRRFHFALLEMARLPRVTSIVESLWVPMGPLLRVFHADIPKRIAGPDHAHYRVLEALERRDGPAAKAALIEDINLSEALATWLEERAEAEAAAS